MRVSGFVFLVLLLPLAGCWREPARGSTPPLAQDVYVWQRAHTAAVSDAIVAHSRSFQTTVVLAAEVSWEKAPPVSASRPASSRPAAAPAPILRTVRITPDWSALATVPRLGLALRINAYPGPFVRDDATARALTALAHKLIAEATAHQVDIAEFQVDFDAATAKLAGYREWLSALREAVAPVPVIFTALPTWIDSVNFPALARAADGYVLQVHSLARPAYVTSVATLCDPIAARAAIERAAQIGVPFRVALPTYGYLLAFDRSGRFARLSTELTPDWQDSTSHTFRELSADPTAIAGLVRALGTKHPAALKGIIWYRLPVAGDHLNWSWSTLAAVRTGKIPAAQLTVTTERTDHGLIEFVVTNQGNGDFAGSVRLAARWQNARLVGADALHDFALTNEKATALQLAAPSLRLAAGERRTIGWLRLSSSTVLPDVSLQD